MTRQRGEILCIHYYFPPLDSTATIRNYHVAKALSDFYEKVHVLTSDNHKRFPSLQKHFPSNLSRYDIFTFDYRRLLTGGSNKDVHRSSSTKSSRWYKFALKIQKSFPFNLVLAEGNLIYILMAYLKAKKLISAGKISTIYSSFGPYSDHYVAYLLKCKFKHLRWIADFRDLQIEPIYKNVIWKNFQHNIERKILSKADLITCISEGFVKQLIPYDRPTIAMLRGVQLREKTQQFDKFTISYTGSLYFNYRDPRPLFACLKNLILKSTISKKKIDIVYAGRDSETFTSWINEYDLNSCYVNRGLVSQEEAKMIQNRSHINVLLTSSSTDLTGVLTGKVFEYFEALNPILCLINGVQDPEFESLFEELNAGVVVYAPEISANKMSDFILTKYNEWSTHQSVKSTLKKDRILNLYSWKQQVSKMLQP